MKKLMMAVAAGCMSVAVAGAYAAQGSPADTDKAGRAGPGTAAGEMGAAKPTPTTPGSTGAGTSKSGTTGAGTSAGTSTGAGGAMGAGAGAGAAGSSTGSSGMSSSTTGSSSATAGSGMGDDGKGKRSRRARASKG